MIQSPMNICRERKLHTLAMCLGVVVCLVVPGLMTLTGICSEEAARNWLEAYQPIVYLETGTEPDAVEALRQEIEGWPFVESAALRSSQDAYDAVATQLGEDVVRDLGLAPDLMPASIVVHPGLPVAGHIDLVSRVSGLEARMEVESVDVPSTTPMRVMKLAGVLSSAALVAALVALLAGFVLLVEYLERLHVAEKDASEILAIFGAYPSQIWRATLIRGSLLGAACGLGASLVLLGALTSWQLLTADFLGVAASTPLTAWPLATAPLAVGPFLGAVAALWVSRRKPVRTGLAYGA